jgi:hypothetical protein
MKPMKHLRSDEAGWVLVVAIAVMSLILALGLATLAIVDTQQQQGRKQRVRESSFNLAEGMLFSSSQLLARHWPSQSGQAFPDCTQGSSGVALCTDPATVTAATGSSNPLFGGADYARSGTVNWTVQVRDNGDSNGNVLSNYDKATANGTQRKCSIKNTTVANCAAAGGTTVTCNPTAGTVCSWDFNGDNQVFVRSESQVLGTNTNDFRRRIVALLKLEVRQAAFNSNVVQAGWIDSTNQGKDKVLVDAQGTSSAPSNIVLTCDPATTTNCPDQAMTSTGKNQINPPDQYATKQTVSTGLTQDDYDNLQIDQTYNDATGCPDKNDPAAWAGTVLLDFSSSSTVCPIASNVVINAPPADPGFLVINCGTVQMLGTSDYYGVIYGRNTCNNKSTPVVDLGGGGVVHGGVTVDNGGGVAVGGKEGSVTYTPNELGGGKVAGTAGLVQSTWRELTPSQ